MSKIPLIVVIYVKCPLHKDNISIIDCQKCLYHKGIDNEVFVNCKRGED